MKDSVWVYIYPHIVKVISNTQKLITPTCHQLAPKRLNLVTMEVKTCCYHVENRPCGFSLTKMMQKIPIRFDTINNAFKWCQMKLSKCTRITIVNSHFQIISNLTCFDKNQYNTQNLQAVYKTSMLSSKILVGARTTEWVWEQVESPLLLLVWVTTAWV